MQWIALSSFLQPQNSLIEWLYFNTSNYLLEVSVKRREENVSSTDSKMASLQSRARWGCSIVKNGNYTILLYSTEIYLNIFPFPFLNLGKPKPSETSTSQHMAKATKSPCEKPRRLWHKAKGWSHQKPVKVVCTDYTCVQANLGMISWHDRSNFHRHRCWNIIKLFLSLQRFFLSCLHFK